MTQNLSGTMQRKPALLSERSVALIVGLVAVAVQLAWFAALGYGAVQLAQLLA